MFNYAASTRARNIQRNEVNLFINIAHAKILRSLAFRMKAPINNRQLQFEQLETLRKAAWESIVSRRGVEWRISVALWTLQAAFIAVLRSIKDDLGVIERFSLVLFSVFMAIGYYDWLIQMFKAYVIDKREEGDLRKQMGEIARYERYSELDKSIEDMANQRWHDAMNNPLAIVNTMHCAQLATTTLLMFLAIGVICKLPFMTGQ